MEGWSEGDELGTALGLADVDGSGVVSPDGDKLGTELGRELGKWLGTALGLADNDGSGVESPDGLDDNDGAGDGAGLGALLGLGLGISVGAGDVTGFGAGDATGLGVDGAAGLPVIITRSPNPSPLLEVLVLVVVFDDGDDLSLTGFLLSSFDDLSSLRLSSSLLLRSLDDFDEDLESSLSSSTAPGNGLKNSLRLGLVGDASLSPPLLSIGENNLCSSDEGTISKCSSCCCSCRSFCDLFSKMS